MKLFEPDNIEIDFLNASGVQDIGKSLADELVVNCQVKREANFDI